MEYVPQLLTIDEIKAAARKGVEEGYIGWLKGMKHCRYEQGNGGRCAVGCAMTQGALDEARSEGTMGGGVSELKARGVLDISGETEARASGLQTGHDQLCGLLHGFDTFGNVTRHREETLYGEQAVAYIEEKMINFLCHIGFALDQAIHITGSKIHDVIKSYQEEI